MFKAKLEAAWAARDSMVCVGLDPVLDRLPDELQSSSVPYFQFCKAVVDAAAPYACAFKPQFAHFASVGREAELADLTAYIRQQYPDHVLILDAKRGDVGSTADHYAREAFERYEADAVTLSPYLGKEAIAPFLRYTDRGAIVLCRTSNPSSDWLQRRAEDALPIYLDVARSVAGWPESDQCALVAGATYPEELGLIREAVGEMPLLVPGVGAQGGDLAAVLENGRSPVSGRGLMISSSRGILYAYGETHCADWRDRIGEAARQLRDQIIELS